MQKRLLPKTSKSLFLSACLQFRADLLVAVRVEAVLLPDKGEVMADLEVPQTQLPQLSCL
jgi:hypothetical protein